MTESEFQQNMSASKTFMELCESPESEYWYGYQRGCRRNYHGDRFGTESEHQLWLSIADDKYDNVRKYRGLGYVSGFSGIAVADTIKHLQRLIAEETV